MPVEAVRKEHTIAEKPYVMAERKKLAERLLAFRVEHNIARRVVADLVGCSQSNIKWIEDCKSAPSFSLALALNRLLSLTPNSVRRLMREANIKP